MKNISAKNMVIIVLLFSNVATAALLASKLSTPASVLKTSEKPARVKKKVEKAPSVPGRHELKEAFVVHNSEIERCYDDFLHKAPKVAQGTVVLNWVIEPNGAPIDVQLMNSDFQNEELESCLITNVAKMNFSPRAETVKVNYRFKFKPETPEQIVFR